MSEAKFNSNVLLSASLPWRVEMRGCEYYVTGRFGRVTPDLGNSGYAEQLARWIVENSKTLTDNSEPRIMSKKEIPTEVLPQRLREMRKAACRVVEYRTCNSDVVDAIYALDTAADRIEQLIKENAEPPKEIERGQEHPKE